MEDKTHSYPNGSCSVVVDPYRHTPEPMPQLARRPFIEEFDYEEKEGSMKMPTD